MPAVAPGCNDSGNKHSGLERAERVRVYQLADVAPDTAVYLDGVIYIRDGRVLPKQTRRWFRAPRCDTAGTFELTGMWLGVTGPKKPRYNGDIRLPYRLEVRVTSGPTRYVGATITVQATEMTDPALTKEDVRTSLWKSGSVTISGHCANRHFYALALRT